MRTPRPAFVTIFLGGYMQRMLLGARQLRARCGSLGAPSSTLQNGGNSFSEGAELAEEIADLPTTENPSELRAVAQQKRACSNAPRRSPSNFPDPHPASIPRAALAVASPHLKFEISFRRCQHRRHYYSAAFPPDNRNTNPTPSSEAATAKNTGHLKSCV